MQLTQSRRQRSSVDAGLGGRRLIRQLAIPGTPSRAACVAQDHAGDRHDSRHYSAAGVSVCRSATEATTAMSTQQWRAQRGCMAPETVA